MAERSDNTRVVPAANYVRLIVVNQRGRERKCEARLNDKVRRLKKTLTYSEPSSIDLVHNDIIMEDNLTLSQYNVKDGDSITVVDKKVHVAEGAGSVDWVFPEPPKNQPNDLTLGGMLEYLRKKVPSSEEEKPQNALADGFKKVRKHNKRKREAERGKPPTKEAPDKKYEDYTLSQAQLKAMLEPTEFVPPSPPTHPRYRKHIALIPEI